ncbi:MAG: molybdopterin-dependent oxidoreductase, partial [Burkholderiaceae bacterium]|nr:molybdopterin-dependent oxidoreductase [Burkholderiaceae bacterium]
MNAALPPEVAARPAPVEEGEPPAPAGLPLAHESAELHVCGQAQYIDDLPLIEGTLWAAPGLSTQAHARIVEIDLSAVLASPGVVAVLTARDIPGVNDCGPVLHDDPILADGLVQCIGQPIFLVLAASHREARRAAARARVQYEPLAPVLSIAQAQAQQSYVLPPVTLVHGDAPAAIAAAPRRLSGRLAIGGQEQFYLEGQVAYAVPREGGAMLVYSSTQHPSEMQHLVAQALGLP